jgi:uncharacterized protein YbjT (DUF2867 family)
MKIVVIGGAGLIGSTTVANLARLGHETIAASPSTGVNTITGEGLAEALAGADVVVDVSNSPSFEDEPVMTFFQTSSRNLLAAAQAAGVKHHVALSVVGVDGLQSSGYFRAKLAQEALIKASSLPWTILRSTQFFQFVSGIVHSAAEGEAIRLSPALVQPIAADDVATVLTQVVVGAPRNDTLEVAGPESFRLDLFAEQYLNAQQDPREVIADPKARYFGAELDDRSLTPGPNPILGEVTFEQWLDEQISAD